jgi:hypothetical protein
LFNLRSWRQLFFFRGGALEVVEVLVTLGAIPSVVTHIGIFHALSTTRAEAVGRIGNEFVNEPTHGLPADLGTIENHLAHFVELGELKVGEVVSTQHQKIIRGIVRSFDKAYSLSDVKNLLPNDYSYAEIKLVIADMNKENE